MQNNIKAYYRPSNPGLIWVARLLLLCLAVIITYKSLVPSLPALEYKNLDKLLHMLAYGAITVSLLFAAPRLPLRQVFIWPLIYGTILEGLQGQFGQGRTASIWDILANMTGIILAILAWLIVTHWRAD